MLRKEEEPFLVTAWAEVPTFASLLERSDERAKIFMFAFLIGTLYPCNSFCIVSTLKKLFHCFFYAYYPVLAVLLCSNLSSPLHKKVHKPGLCKNVNHVQPTIRSYQYILADQYTETLGWIKLLHGVEHQYGNVLIPS